MDSNNMEMATILKELEETITNASRVPLTGKVMVDGDTLLEFVDRIYSALPSELRQAQQVLEQSDKLLESVEGQGKRILQDARDQAAMMLQETEIFKAAAERAQALMSQAEAASLELRRQSIIYSDDVLSHLEGNLEQALTTIRNNRSDLQKF